MTHLGAIILTGGGARRLGGVDKASVQVGGATLLDHAIDTASACDPVVVVGPAVDAHPGVTFTREDPVGGGPVAGIAAGLASLDAAATHVLVLACDMPLAGAAVQALLSALAEAEAEPAPNGAWAVDNSGRAQPLLAVYRRDALTRALNLLGDPHGASVRALTAGLTMIEVPVGDAARDADTWDDVRALREEIR